VASLQRVGRDHAGWPGGICQHARDVAATDRWVTVASTIAELSAEVVWVAQGPPCEHPYVAFDVETGQRVDGGARSANEAYERDGAPVVARTTASSSESLGPRGEAAVPSVQRRGEV
jgi:hypothetical protein